MKSLTYYFHIKTKVLADFQICISVPLTTRPHNLLMMCIFKCIYLLMTNKLKSSELKYLCVNDKYCKLKSSHLKYLLTYI